MKIEPRSGLEFSYNILNLPSEVQDSPHNMQMRYTYLSDGTKISALDAAGNGLLYRGNFVYDKTGNTVNLESVAWDEGRIRNTEFLAQHDDELIEIGDTLAVIDPLPDLPWHPGLHATDDQLQPDSGELVDETAFEHAALFQDQWFVRDHLGNVRSVIDLSGSQNASNASLILEQDDYLPYGTKVVNGSQSSLSSNRYRYAGKEEQRIGSFSSQLLDFGARSYDPWTCRWTTVDPLAQKYFGMSPYNYCGNDPVNFFDPDGNSIESAWDIANVIMDAKSLVSNIKQSKVGASIVDGLGLIADAAAVVLPIVPAGAGISIKAIRSGNTVADVTKAATQVSDAAKGYEKVDNVIEGANTANHVHGNSKLSTNAQHCYDIYDSETGKVVKTGISGGGLDACGISKRAESQVKRWNKAENTSKYKSKIINTIPEGEGARLKALEYESQRAAILRMNGEIDPTKHKRP